MAFQAHEGALIERFSSAGVVSTSILDMDTFESVRNHMRFLTEEGDRRGVQVQMDMGTVEQLGGGLRGLNAAAAAKQKEERARRERNRDHANRQLQALLDQIKALDDQIDALQGKIDEINAQIDTLNETMRALRDGSLDPEQAVQDPIVRDAIKDWEKRTGKKFDPNADNASDVLVAILASQVDELGNDVASLETKKGILEAQRSELLQQADAIQTSIDNNAPAAVIEAQVAKASETVEGARIVAKELQENEAVSELAREGHDGHSDVEFNKAQRQSNNEEAFGGLGDIFNSESAGLTSLPESEPDVVAEITQATSDITNTPGMGG